MHDQPKAIVVVPTDAGMATEPARVIAKAMQVKNAVAIILAAGGLVLSPQLSGSVDTLIQAAILVAFAGYQVYTTFKQGEDTRMAVYSPTTMKNVLTEVADQTGAKVITAPPPPGNEKDGIKVAVVP